MTRRRTLAGRIPVGVRWKIALLVKRFPWACWAELVNWAINPDNTTSTLGRSLGEARRCATLEDVTSGGACYCGRVRTPDIDPLCTGRAIRPCVRPTDPR